MRKKRISVVVKRVGMPPERVMADNTTEGMQSLIGGYMEGHVLRDDLMLLCDEEGTIFGKEYNITVNGIDYVGTVVFVGLDEEDFNDAPEDVEWLWRS